MDGLQVELAKLRRDANLTQSIEDVDKIIEQLERAREAIVAGKKGFILRPGRAVEAKQFRLSAEGWRVLGLCRTLSYIVLTAISDPSSASFTLAKIQNPMKSGFDKVNDDLKKVHKGQSSYGKALDKVGTTSNTPTDLC